MVGATLGFIINLYGPHLQVVGNIEGLIDIIGKNRGLKAVF